MTLPAVVGARQVSPPGFSCPVFPPPLFLFILMFLLLLVERVVALLVVKGRAARQAAAILRCPFVAERELAVIVDRLAFYSAR
jgi:hypothetical protein